MLGFSALAFQLINLSIILLWIRAMVPVCTGLHQMMIQYRALRQEHGYRYQKCFPYRYCIPGYMVAMVNKHCSDH